MQCSSGKSPPSGCTSVQRGSGFWDIRHLCIAARGPTWGNRSLCDRHRDIGATEGDGIGECSGPDSGARSDPADPPRSGEKGLKKNAIGFVSSVVIGVASTAPGYSLAATLGFIAAAVGLQAPAVLLVSFIPMFLVAAAYYYMNKADPDCGTSFSWVTKAMGPQLGWIAGWTIVVADVIVMANLAQIAGLYTFLLFGLDSAADVDLRA